jgi:hypothetical protein
MSAGIGGIGNLGGNIGGNAGMNQASAVPKDPLDAAALNVHHKKHKEEDASIEALLNNLNDQKVTGTQSGTTGETGTRINKYA